MHSPSPPSIEAVLFDYGMVLSGPPDPAAWSEMIRLTSLSEDAFHTAYWAPRHAYDEGHLTGEAYWRKVTQSCTAPLPDAALSDLLAADITLWTQPNFPMIQWAEHLQQSGIKTGILSNLGDAMASGVLRKFSWLSHFTHCTWSHTLKIAKPDPAIYRHAAQGLNTPPASILFIDDRAVNIAAARSTGMFAIEYSSHTAFLQEIEHLGLGHLLPPQ